MAANKIDITEVDFDNNKQSLKTFLQAQSEFTDYDFEGSGLNILLDILAYNTTYTAFHANMLANEMFLDSASLRESIVSIAKHLNYTPRSAVAPTALLNVVFNPTVAPTSITIEANTKFISSIDGTTYNFVTVNPTTIQPINGIFLIQNLAIKEGTLLNFDILVDTTDDSQRFIIPNKDVDISTLKIIVQTSTSDTTSNLYTQASSVMTVTATDKVFWVQEVEGEKFELYFGNGVIGKVLSNGNVVKMTYLVTNGPAANKASTFTASAGIGGYTGNEVSFTVASAASNGAAIQTKEDIRFLAPKLFESQSRAVTAEDYKTILLEQRSDIGSIAVWGGEDNDPPTFGQVFIAIKPINSLTYSASAKEQIKTEILKTFNVVSITPNIVDVDFTYLKVTANIVYDPLLLIGTTTALTSAVISTIQTYSTNQLNKFEEKVRSSVLTRLIDATDNAIKNSRLSFIIQKRFTPTLSVSASWTLKYNTVLTVSSLTSNTFTVTGGTVAKFDDDGVGNVRLVNSVDATVISATIGTINYSSGAVLINNFTPLTIVDGTTEIRIDLTPSNPDLIPLREQVITIDADDSTAISVNIASDNT